MKKLLMVVIAVASLGMSMVACQNLGSNISAFWNNAQVQADIKAAEQIAITFAQNWITSHLGASRSLKSTGAQAAMAQAHDAIKAKYPTMPDNVINDIVTSKFATQ